jgi:hypothetical protein
MSTIMPITIQSNPWIAEPNGNYANDQLLIEDLVNEAVTMMGQQCIYIVIEHGKLDPAFVDSDAQRVLDYHTLPLLCPDIESFVSAENSINKFGINFNDSTTFYMPIRMFNQLGIQSRTRPMVGDLVFHTLSRTLFTIREVPSRFDYAQMSHKSTYKLSCSIASMNKIIADALPAEFNLRDVIDINTAHKFENNDSVAINADAAKHKKIPVTNPLFLIPCGLKNLRFL